MKRLSSIFLGIALLFGVMVTMSFANPAAKGARTIAIPDKVKSQVIDVAKDNGFIGEREAAILEETDAIQQCVDAFVASGYDPSAVVDKLAEISVEKGYYTSTGAAKKGIRRGLEEARKSEANWTKLYAILGL